MRSSASDLCSHAGICLSQYDQMVMDDFVTSIGVHRFQGTEALKSFLARLKQLGLSEGPGSSRDRTEHNYWHKIVSSLLRIRLLARSHWRDAFFTIIRESEQRPIYESKKWYSERATQIRSWLQNLRSMQVIQKDTKNGGMSVPSDLTLSGSDRKGKKILPLVDFLPTGAASTGKLEAIAGQSGKWSFPVLVDGEEGKLTEKERCFSDPNPSKTKFPCIAKGYPIIDLGLTDHSSI